MNEEDIPTQELYINGSFTGTVKSYQQEARRFWTFTLTTGKTLKIPFRRIRKFNSCGKLEILLTPAARTLSASLAGTATTKKKTR